MSIDMYKIDMYEASIWRNRHIIYIGMWWRFDYLKKYPKDSYRDGTQKVENERWGKRKKNFKYFRKIMYIYYFCWGKQRGKSISSIVLGATVSSYWDISVLQCRQIRRSWQVDVDSYFRHTITSPCFTFLFTKETGGYHLNFHVHLPIGRKCTLLKTKITSLISL